VAIMTGGSIENSYAHNVSLIHYDPAVDLKGGIVGKITGGSITNCYSYVTSSGDKFYGATTLTGTALTNAFGRCYLVNGGAQGGVAIVTTANAAATSGENALVTLLNADGKPSGGYTWIHGTTAPILQMP
jgi:hypothetical protein